MKFTTKIQLTEKQAQLVIKKYYSEHLDFTVPIEERKANNPEFVLKEKHKKNKEILFKILTSPVGTEYQQKKVHNSRGPGYTEITLIKDESISLIGFNDETTEHVDMASIFIRAETFSWFKKNYRL